MLGSASLVLLAAGALGVVLAMLHGRPGGRAPPWGVGVVHGLLGLFGLVGLLLALRGKPRGVAMGVEDFGAIAAVLLGLALLAGGGPLLFRLRRRKLPVLVIALHAGLAITGLVILAAYVLLGNAA